MADPNPVSAGGPSGDQDSRSRVRALADAAAEELRERLGGIRSLRLGPRARARIARRFRETVDSALEVSPDLAGKTAARVARLREKHPDADPVELAWARTRSRARRAAAAGAVTTAPAMLPGVGTALAALGLVADWRFVAEQQRDLVLEVAGLLGVTLDDPAEEVRTLFLASTGAAFGAARVGEAAAKAAAKRWAERGVSRLVPGLGAAVSGALNYVSTLAVGRAAIARFAERAGLDVRGVAPQATHPALPRLRQAVVGAVKTAALGDGARPVFTREQREIVAHLPLPERQELLDLAVVGAAVDGVTPEEESILSALAGELGFGAAELGAARRDAEGGFRRARRRFVRALGTSGRGGRRAARRLWNEARRLARRGHPEDG